MNKYYFANWNCSKSYKNEIGIDNVATLFPLVFAFRRGASGHK